MKRKIETSRFNISKIKLFLTLILCAMMSLVTKAQDEKVREKPKTIADYKAELGLSDSQLEQIKTIQKEYFPKMKEARANEDRAILKRLNDERKAKIEQVLSPEQAEKWKSIIEKKKAELQNPELKRELKEYKKQNIKPVILEQRKAFETELSGEEKLLIADLRAKHQAFRKSAKDLSDEERNLRIDELKMESQETLKPIIEKYKSTLEKIRQDLEPSSIQWEKDMDAIKSKYISDYRPNKKQKRKNEMRLIIRFLLMPFDM